jgi:hypothetical protein
VGRMVATLDVSPKGHLTIKIEVSLLSTNLYLHKQSHELLLTVCIL